MRPRDGVPPELIRFAIQRQEAEIASWETGSTFTAINKRHFKDIRVTLPPQDLRDELVNMLRRTVMLRRSAESHLARARAGMARFRQSVLAAACSGRLTADRRVSNPAADSIDQALAASRILRRRRLQSEQPVDLELPGLPATYRVHAIDEISTVLDYGTSKRAGSSAEEVPVLRMGNIQVGELDLSDLKFIQRDSEIDGLMLKDGDLLFNRTNSPELVGKSAVFHSDQPVTFASYLIRVRFAPAVAEPDFVNLWINSAWGKEWARLTKTDCVSQSNINGSKLGLLAVPLPPIAEQREIVKRVLGLLRTADEIGRQIDQAVVATKRLETATTERALRGEPAKSGATS